MWNKSMDWFLYDNGLRYERVNTHLYSAGLIAPRDKF